MPTPGPIRKEILSALENHLLPVLRQQQVPIGYITPALRFPAGITTRHLTHTAPRPETKNIDYPLHTRWPKASLHSSHVPYFGLLYKGTIAVRTLITAAQAGSLHPPKGIHAIHLHAPAMLIYPPYVARDSGSIDYQPDPDTGPQEMRSLWGSFHSGLGELLIHTHIKNAQGQRVISHSLQMADPAIITLTALLMQAMPKSLSDNQEYPSALLLALLECIYSALRSSQGRIANTSRSPLPQSGLTTGVSHDACHNSAIYIQMHLHEPITLTQIARHAGLSPAHLNRLFQQQYGITVMRYVRQQRIAAAQKILKQEPENIAEVATLMGFKRVSAFCELFKQETGLTPSQFRRKAHQSR